jgi:FKBP-type peptidyl-prolyl cis-trans isomerase FkpA
MPSVRLIALVLAAAATAVGCDSGPSEPSNLFPTAPFTTTDVSVGTGAEAAAGTRVTVNYTGWFYDPFSAEDKGDQFDSSQGGTPFSFVLGANQVIPGFDQGVTGMRVGGLRRVIVPPDLAYGAGGVSGLIPPNATLLFEVELIAVATP